jgi:thermospermine synthase
MLLTRIIHTGKSQYQDVEIVETVPYGKMLLLDGKMQSSQADEWAYHEALVHVALLHHPNPKTVFIVSGAWVAGTGLIFIFVYISGGF